MPIQEGRVSDTRTALLASIVDSSDDAIVSKTPDGAITSWNRAAELIYGYSAEEVLGKPISIVTHPDRPHEMDEILRRIRMGERVEHYETLRVRKDGTTISISLSVSPIYDAQHHMIGASSIARDITERKRADEQLSVSLLMLSFFLIYCLIGEACSFLLRLIDMLHVTF